MCVALQDGNEWATLTVNVLLVLLMTSLSKPHTPFAEGSCETEHQ